MKTTVAQLIGLPVVPVEGPRVSCIAAVFRADYQQCSNRAVKKRGTWKLCAPHARLDEVEIVVDNTTDTVV